MSLSFPVKMNRVNNLSDARYCAGMGVEILGVSNEISENEFLALTNWITGIQICVDLYNTNSDFQGYFSNPAVSYIETEDENFLLDQSLYNAKLVLRIEDLSLEDTLKKCDKNATKFEYFNIINESFSLDDFLLIGSRHEIIATLSSKTDEHLDILCSSDIKYIGLHAGVEISPGLKTFDQIASVLERLEIES